MSEAKEAPKKKSKMPIIAVVVLALAGGGYFAMGSNKKKEAPKEPDLVLGHAVNLGDFVTPMADGTTFLECQVVVKLGEKDHLGEAKADDGHGGGGKGDPDPASRSAILKVLKTTSPEDIKTDEGMNKLKWRIAAEINHMHHVLHQFEKPKEGEEPKEKKKKKKKKDADEHHEVEYVAPEDREYPELDSEDGPVYMVMFPKFLPIDYSR